MNIAIICENCHKKQYYKAPATFDAQKTVVICNSCKKKTRCSRLTYESPPPPKQPAFKPKPAGADDDDDPTIVSGNMTCYSIARYPKLSKLAYLAYKDESGVIKKTFLPDDKKLLLVGRVSAEKQSDVKIHTKDAYLSRQHFYLEVGENNGNYTFKLKQYKPDLTTYMKFGAEWKEVNEQNVFYLEHGSVIGAGHTELVFKVTSLD